MYGCVWMCSKRAGLKNFVEVIRKHLQWGTNFREVADLGFIMSSNALNLIVKWDEARHNSQQLCSYMGYLQDDLKTDSHHPNKIMFICFNESPLKIMKTAFYFILKALFVLKIFFFWSWLPNISRSKDNHTLKFGQVKEYNKIFFFKNHAENEAGRLVPDLFLFFKKALFEVNASDLQLSFNQFRSSSTCQTIKTKYIKL